MNGIGQGRFDDDRDVREFMRRLAALPAGVQPTTSDARLLWLKGQLLRRWEAERLVHRPLDVADRVQLIGGLAAAAAVVLMWSLPALVRLLAEA